VNIAGVDVGPGYPTRVIFEMSNNHNGSLDTALRLADAAKESGADFLKLQAFTPAELVLLRGDGPAPEPWGSDGWTMRALYEKARTPMTWFVRLVEHCRQIELPWFSSVFGIGSLAVLEALECPAYKLAALDHGKRTLLNAVKATGKPILRSCNKVSRPDGTGLWLYCPPGYPQAPVPLPGPLRRYTGFSYHGTDPDVPYLAAAYGAKLIECHVQLDDDPSELESDVSLTVSQLASLVDRLAYLEAWR
jgi:sialic acid synthase SpsE